MKTTQNLCFYHTKIIKYAIIIVFLIFCLPTFANADENFGSSGKEFWMSFPPNYHNDINGDSLYIFITAETPTTGRIVSRDFNFNIRTQNFEITAPGQLLTFQYDSKLFELLSYNNTNTISNQNQSEQKAHQYFHITANQDITVYAHSQAEMTSDAMMLFPVNSLGTNYLVMSYSSDFHRITSSDQSSATPSQFSIIATENNTNITIRPTVATHLNGLNQQNIILNQGQSYLVQARYSTSNRSADLTGTEIISDKPIAVFGSQQRASIPINEATSNTRTPSRDYIVSQIPPEETWGKNFVIVPLEKLNEDNYGTDIYRVLAAEENTNVYFNGTLISRLNRGRFADFPLINAGYLSSDKPVLVAKFKKTSSFFGGARRNGDPFIMIIPPVEQFLSNYSVINVQAWEGDTPVYNAHYIGIMTEISNKDKIYLDNLLLAPELFNDITGSDYCHATLEVIQGVHKLASEGKFGVIIYGYGPANSYGYVGGMGLDVLDLKPPEIYINNKDCYRYEGTVFDSVRFDKGISNIYFDEVNSFNTVLSVNPYNYGSKMLTFAINLIDPFQDGYFSIKAYDIASNITVLSDTIEGFTLSFANIENNFYDFGQVNIASLVCDTLIISNYGLFEKRIEQLPLKNNVHFSIPQAQFPIILAPNEQKSVEICYNPQSTRFLHDPDSLFIKDECNSFGIVLSGEPQGIFFDGNSKCEVGVIFKTNEVPSEYYLEGVFPNPIANQGTLSFGMKTKNKVNLSIYDLNGIEITKLIDGELDSGVYLIDFNVESLPVGSYYVKMKTPQYFHTTKLLIVR